MREKRRILACLLIPFLVSLAGCNKTSETPASGGSPSPAESAAAVTTTKQVVGQLRTASSGLKYEDIEIGSGPRPLIGQSLQIYYTGRLEEGGKPFDSGVFNYNPIKDKTIKGWKIGILGDGEIEPMRVGGRRKLIIPPDLGYGGLETGPVPPNSTLIFEIELKRVIEGQSPLSGN
ncbi:MAG: FKBP-type peptidyl-prolyl cis-trans isomerase [Acidobacteriota bacterium]|jgi:peptidylprolyl isomerase